MRRYAIECKSMRLKPGWYRESKPRPFYRDGAFCVFKNNKWIGVKKWN